MSQTLNIKDLPFGIRTQLRHGTGVSGNMVYIGRPSKWGNPFRIGAVYQGRVLTRQDAIEAYKDWLLHSEEGQVLLKDLGELKGKDRVCWCAPQPCHGDFLGELVAQTEG